MSHLEAVSVMSVDEPEIDDDEPSTKKKENIDDYMRGKPFIGVRRIRKYLRKNYKGRISRKASAALIAVIQSLMMDLIKKIKVQVQKGDSKQITPKSISKVIQSNPAYSLLLAHVNIPESGLYGIIGTHPNIVKITQ